MIDEVKKLKEVVADGEKAIAAIHDQIAALEESTAKNPVDGMLFDQGRAVTVEEVQQQVAELKEDNAIKSENLELMKESIQVLEMQLAEQGWVQLFGGGGPYARELSRVALGRINDLVRVYWLKNPLIKRAVTLQALYVFSQGVDIKANDSDIDDLVQKFLEDRKNKVSFTSHQAQMANDMELTAFGNLFFALLTDPDSGRVIVRLIPFDEVMEIDTNPHDIKEVWFYKRQFMQQTLDYLTGTLVTRAYVQWHPDWKYQPPEDQRPEKIGLYDVRWDAPIYHVGINKLADMKFGVSDIYSGLDWAQAYKQFLENLSKVWQALARFAFDLKTKGGSAAVQASKQKMEKMAHQKSPEIGWAEGRPVASVFSHSEGVELSAIKTSGATTSAEDGNKLLLMVCSATGIFQHYLSGDPGKGNMATAKTMERPMELQFLNRRTLWADSIKDILQYVIDQSIIAPNGMLHEIGELATDDYTGEQVVVMGKKSDENGEETDELVSREIAVSFPPLLEHDITESVNAIVNAATLGGNGLAGTIDMKTLSKRLFEVLDIAGSDDLLASIYPEDDAEPILWTRDQKLNMVFKLMTGDPQDPFSIQQQKQLAEFLGLKYIEPPKEPEPPATPAAPPALPGRIPMPEEVDGQQPPQLAKAKEAIDTSGGGPGDGSLIGWPAPYTPASGPSFPSNDPVHDEEDLLAIKKWRATHPELFTGGAEDPMGATGEERKSRIAQHKAIIAKYVQQRMENPPGNSDASYGGAMKGAPDDRS
jgi:hypothetical protein